MLQDARPPEKFPMSDGPIAVWDFTLPKRELTVGDVHGLLRSICKAYTFQLERGDTTGYEHFQGRLSLFKKKRFGELIKHFDKSGIHLTVSSNNSRKGEAFYCMKTDTRIEGPWTEKDFKEPKVPTRQLVESGILAVRRAWQIELAERVAQFDMRTIHMVICPRGGEGKSLFAEWMEHTEQAFEVPYLGTMEDIMQCCMGVPPQKTYLIDMPRSLEKNRLASFFAGIETLKNGVMFDKRYHFKKRRIDRPSIVVFSNKAPDLSYLSRDRWRLWTIKKDRLVDYCYASNSDQRDEEESDGSGEAEGEDTTDDPEVLQSSVSAESFEATGESSSAEEC